MNMVLHLLAHSPPFWTLFTELGDMVRQREAGAPETGRVATPLLYATVRFLREFIFEELPPTGDEADKKELSTVGPFESTYIYDAMKEKRRLKEILVRFCDQDAPFASVANLC